MRRNHAERRKEHQCDLCDKAFYELGQLGQHKKKVHDGIRDKICKICGKTFKETHHLKNHIKGVHEGISWKEVLKIQNPKKPKHENQNVELI